MKLQEILDDQTMLLLMMKLLQKRGFTVAMADLGRSLIVPLGLPPTGKRWEGGITRARVRFLPGPQEWSCELMNSSWRKIKVYTGDEQNVIDELTNFVLSHVREGQNTTKRSLQEDERSLLVQLIDTLIRKGEKVQIYATVWNEKLAERKSKMHKVIGIKGNHVIIEVSGIKGRTTWFELDGNENDDKMPFNKEDGVWTLREVGGGPIII